MQHVADAIDIPGTGDTIGGGKHDRADGGIQRGRVVEAEFPHGPSGCADAAHLAALTSNVLVEQCRS